MVTARQPKCHSKLTKPERVGGRVGPGGIPTQVPNLIERGGHRKAAKMQLAGPDLQAADGQA